MIYLIDVTIEFSNFRSFIFVPAMFNLYLNKKVFIDDWDAEAIINKVMKLYFIIWV